MPNIQRKGPGTFYGGSAWEAYQLDLAEAGAAVDAASSSEDEGRLNAADPNGVSTPADGSKLLKSTAESNEFSRPVRSPGNMPPPPKPSAKESELSESTAAAAGSQWPGNTVLKEADYFCEANKNANDKIKSNSIPSEEGNPFGTVDVAVASLDDDQEENKTMTQSNDEDATAAETAEEAPKKRKRKRRDFFPTGEDSKLDLTNAPRATRGFKRGTVWKHKGEWEKESEPQTIDDFSSAQANKAILQKAYDQLHVAKDRKEVINSVVAELDEELQQLQEKLNAVQARADKAKAEQASRESIVQKAVQVVADIEIKMPTKWNERYAQIREYHEKHGHINLPTRCAEDKEFDSLCIWLNRQKAHYKKYCSGEVTTKKPYKISALEKLGVRWSKLSDKWADNFEKLRAFQRENDGSTVVPTRSHPDRNFSSWVITQRYEYKILQDNKRNGISSENSGSALTQERIDQLNSIGFVWNVFDEKWKEMFGELLQFKEDYGHVHVLERHAPNMALAKWVKRQRMEYQMIQNGEGESRKCKLTEDRIKQLQEVGFNFVQEE